MLRPEITPDHFHQRQAGTLPGQFGLRVTAIAEGRFDVEYVVLPWMHAPNGFLHAASVVMLADTGCGYATIAHLPEGAKNFTTIELKAISSAPRRAACCAPNASPSTWAAPRRSGRRT